ncbi:putative LovB-like polyketide synthase [Aspergillus steynii IBT 23096]|uniref:Putative LovB-like polyketide synthase n=1 Tax=Aspergillus steynii IBT 23096 TaxID=1392250 RepID=A0A2I2GAF9_9EURO|nr:putative LovB-like polyketide synthase [Aspergillus steynii IBT 23096]PLB49865.1 putative LovB-like polyketide synthase [Aspergillus steynii IBT 23096]
MSMHFERPQTSQSDSTNGVPGQPSPMETQTKATDHPCVIGMACRVPGASSPSKLWDNLINKVDLQRKMPADRFNVDAFYHPDGTHKGSTNAKYGYFLDQDVGLFDAGFFNISGKEATAMDPQQRLLLEVVYEALENAGITLDEIQGSQTSVYCGCFTNDYNAMTTKDLEYYPKYTVTGTGNSILANRISYFYDLHGPSATIDTACSSSLVCFHMGAQSLRAGEADLSIVVGSALHFDPNIFITMTDLGMLSTDGRCRHGDASGSGYVRGEGITAMILKRQRQAESSGDSIRAVVRGTGVNHDGRKQGITLPSAQAQAALIRSTYQNAGLDPADTTYVECHGTGTKAGDPRELRAISEVFSSGRERPLFVGSIKTNIGHLEGASGVAGLIKSTLALEKKTIPPNMHFHAPNPDVDFDQWKLEIPTNPTDWKIKSSEAPRRVSINSFGYGGTNAHVILEEYKSTNSLPCTADVPADFANMTRNRPYLVPLSSHSEKAGKLMANKLQSYLQDNVKVSPAEFAMGLSQRRTMHRFRSFAIGSSAETLIGNLEEPVPAAQWKSKLETAPRVGFVFTGQGAQWFGMGRALIEQCPLYLQTLQKCDQILQSLCEHRPTWSIVTELLRTKEDTKLSQTEYSQPICTAVQLALVDVLAQWGIKPASVVGHSSGELAATYAAGILSFENALIAAYYRGVHMGGGAAAPDSIPGAMMAVGMTEAEVNTELEPYAGRVAVAAMNSPSSFTLSGDSDAIAELHEKLSERKVFARRLQVAQAFHSHHMYPLAPGYEQALSKYSGFKANKSACASMVSSVTGRKADPSTMGPEYFAANMTGMVKFSDALTETVLDEEDQQNVDILIEVGPHPALKGPSNQTIDQLKMKIPYIGTLDRKQDAYESLLATAGQLFALGYPVLLEEVNRNQFIDSSSGNLVSPNVPQVSLELPSYAWDHERYWGETRVIKEHRLRPFRHSILGAPVPGSLANRPRWRNFLRISEMPWLRDHSIDGKVVFPGAGYINMAMEAVARLGYGSTSGIKAISLADISVKSALVVSDHEVGTEVIVELSPVVESAKTSSSTWNNFVIFSIDESGNQREHCTGTVKAELGDPEALPSGSNSKAEVQTFRCVGREQYYHRLHSMGLQYGKTFQLLSGSIDSGLGNATAPISWQPDLFSPEDSDLCIVHPAFLDAAFHPVFASIEGKLGRTLKEPYVPTFVRSMKVSGLLEQRKGSSSFEGQVSVETNVAGPRTASNDLRIQDQDGQMLIEIQGLELTNLGANSADDGRRSLFFGTEWQPMLSSIQFNARDIPKFQDIPALVKLYAHQFPNKTILHHTRSVSSTEEVLGSLRGTSGERRNFAQLVISLQDSTVVSTFDEIVQRWNGLVRVATSEDMGEEKFDLVVVSDTTEGSMHDRVSDQGYMLVDNSSVEIPAGFRSVGNCGDVQVWQKKPYANGIHARPLTIVMPTQSSPEIEAFAEAIEAQGSFETERCDFLSLADLNRELAQNVIVLSSLDSQLYFHANASGHAEFYAAQSLLTKGTGNIVWVTRGGLMDVTSPEQALILGLARSARSENPDLRLVVFDIAPKSGPARAARLASELLDPSIDENEIAERDGTLYIPRVVSNDQLNAKIPNGVGSEATIQPLYQPNRPLALRIGRPGLLESLTFADDAEIQNEPLGPNDLEIEVKSSAINFRDIAASMGIIDDFKLGDECAGIVIRKGSDVSEAFSIGDRVVAWRPGQGAHRTVVRNPACLCYRLGEIPFSIAAAIPLILTTAHYSLVDTARLQPGETVLIHSAAGGVGQMAIQIAQNIGAEIIATVGSPSKRELLIDRYGLKESQILSSRDDSFVQGVHRLTNGKGVDVALNSLAGPLLHATWLSLAPFGRFVEIGKRDIHQNSRIPMDPFRRNVSFASVDMITVFEKNQSLGARVFQECCGLVHDGKIQPPEPITELSYSDAQKGFRMLQMGTTIGKIVLVPKPDDRVLVEPTKFNRRQLFLPGKTYLLVGGLGGLGRRLSEWLFQRGARNVAFLARSGADKKDARETVDWLRARDVEVTVFRGDVTDARFVQEAVNQIGATRLAGVFQAAMVLQDGPLDKMGFTQWQRCIDPKVRGTFNLHSATSDIDLDFFVCFSSVSAILGSKGQANYSAANTYLDALCAYRRSIGLAGTTMNVGMITGIGAVSEDAKLQTIMERIGYDAVNEEELFAQIEAAVSSERLSIADDHGRDAHQIITGVNLRRPDYYWATEPRFQNLYANHDFAGSGSGSGAQKNLMAQLQEASDEASRTEILTMCFLEKIAAVLSVDQATLQPNRSLADYGLDSIVAIEIRQWFFQTVAVEIAMFDVLNSGSIQALVDKVAKMIVLGTSEVQTTTQQGESTSSHVSEASRATLPKIVGTAIDEQQSSEDVAMSTFQRRLWFAHNMAEDPSFLNLPTVFRVKGKPQPDLLRQALEELKRRNDILRTAYFEGDIFSQQAVTDDCAVDLPVLDLSNTVDLEESLQQQVSTMRQQALDIESGQVMKAALAKLADAEYALVLIFHHICIDRGSSQSFLEQITSLYDSLRRETNLDAVSRPSVSYAQFSQWHNAQLGSKEMESSVEFWRNEYREPPAPMKLLPFAQITRPEFNDYQRQIHRATLKDTLQTRMKRICARLGVTPAQFLMAAFRVFLYRYGQEDVLTLHMVDGNRPHPAVNDTLGFFVNVVPVRCATDLTGTFDDVLKQMKDRIMKSLAHSQLPFDAIVDAVGLERTPAHFPLGQVIVNYQIHGTMPTYSAGDFDIVDVQGEDIPTACELGLEALEDPAKGLLLRLESSSSLYGAADMERFLDNFVAFMSSVIRDPRQPVADIDMVGPKEFCSLKERFFNMTYTENEWNNQSVTDRIVDMAREHPTAIAIETSEGDELTYRELLVAAESIATVIRNVGVPSGSRVGVFSRPGRETITAMMGVLLAGCGFVALDPEFASERLAFMISDSGIPLVLAGPELGESARSLASRASVAVLDIASIPTTGGSANISVPLEKNSPFYVIYTSGSTGTPKGVVLSQSNTQQMLSTLHHDFKFTAKDRFLHHSSISFDLSIVQIFSALTAGARVCVASSTIRKDPVALAAYMEASQVSITYFTPTQFALLMEHATEKLQNLRDYRIAYFAGERLPLRVTRAFYDLGTPAVVYNTWSPSELVVQTTIQRVDRPGESTTNIPIGYPMANSPHYILDDRGKPLPAGVVGEIVVGGAQVGLGYINRPEANAKAFLPDPFSSPEDKEQRGWTRMFRTGDRGRFLPGGNLEFHGRIAGDKQIKLRGYRIDLGEVEHRLFVEANKDPAGPGVIDLTVIARTVVAGDGAGDDRQLIAFVVPKQPLGRLQEAEFAVRLNKYGVEHLNAYMLPSAYQFLEALPVTIGGKIDRQRLLHGDLRLTYPVEQDLGKTDHASTSHSDGEDTNNILMAVMDGFREVLKLPRERVFLPSDSFFALGGNSILLVRLQARLKRALKKPLALNPMFKTPTPQGIAQILGGTTSSAAPAATRPEVNWDEETSLDLQLQPAKAPAIASTDVSSILITGADSFIGVHTLATVLQDPGISTVYILGSQKPLEYSDVERAFELYRLWSVVPSPELVASRIICVAGTLESPRFGLSPAQFRRLGSRVQAIYHLGGYVSLLRSYDALRPLNVSPVRDVIELASLGAVQTHIHHLSTWSVPHLQTWSTSQRSAPGETIANEVPAGHFTPEASNRFGYFKSRWVAERLMEKAAERGFPVTIYRASAATGHRTTGIPEPKDDFIRTMILSMVRAAVVPDLPDTDRPFMADFIPVDYLTQGFHALATNEAHPPQETSATIHHLCNPSPLPISRIPEFVGRLLAQGDREGRVVPVAEWLETVSRLDDSSDAQIRWEVLKEYFNLGHNMFALESAQTRQKLGRLGVAECAPMGEEYLRNMLATDAANAQ